MFDSAGWLATNLIIAIFSIFGYREERLNAVKTARVAFHGRYEDVFKLPVLVIILGK